MDDLKVSQNDDNIVSAFCVKISQLYGSGTKSSWGKVYNLLGMDLDWSCDGVFIVSMIKYLQKIIDDFPEETCATKVTPANDNLFKIREDGEEQLLLEEQTQAYHHTTAQLMFLAMRDRPDVQPVVSFLTKRVRAPDEDDWGKLKNCLKYLKGTLHMKLYLTADSLSIIH